MSEDGGDFWPFFEADAERNLADAEDALQAFRGAPEDQRDEILNALYRVMHTFKGNARMMGLPNLSQLAHKAEDLVGFARSGRAALDGERFELVLETIDLFAREIPNLVGERRDIEGPECAGLLSKLIDAAHQVETPTEATGPDLANQAVVLFDELPTPDLASEPVVLFDELPAEASPAPPERPAPRRPERVAEEAPTPRQGGSENRDGFIQVRGSKIQELLSLTANLGLVADEVLAFPPLETLVQQHPEMGDALQRLRSITREVRTASAALALVPVGTLFRRFGRAIRELRRSTGKDIELLASGEEVEIDKSVVDRLFDPMLHMVRNSADHGLETKEERVAAGKRPTGTIRLEAEQSGGEVLIRVRDDGRGLALERIRQIALEKGLIDPEYDYADEDVARFIMLPGFSTRDAVSELSGRGVGMDVVNDMLERAGGKIDIATRPGQGTTFHLRLPLTLAFADALVVEVSRVLFAIPLQNIGGVFALEPGQLVRSSAQGADFFLGTDGKHRIRRLLPDLDRPLPDVVVTVRSSRGAIALPVDEIRSTEQLTVRPLAHLIEELPHVAACGVVGTGEVAMILDCEELVRAA